MSGKKILLIGGGGHCGVIADCIKSSKAYQIAGVIDATKKRGVLVQGIPVVGSDTEMLRFFREGIRLCIVAVGSIGDARPRERLYKQAKRIGFSFPNIISPRSTISSAVTLGEGIYVGPGVVINTGTKIGNNAIVNTGAVIDHDSGVGAFVHVSPGAILSGGVEVGDYSHIGTGAVVIQYIKIGPSTLIGAGSVVTKNIPGNVVAYGRPCKVIRKNA